MCEGKRDRIFVEETLRNRINLEPSKIKNFEEPRLLERAITFGERVPVLICDGNGFPGNTRVAVRLSCKFMRYAKSICMGVVGDSDRGSVYGETIAYLTSYLGTPCKAHAIHPQITKLDSDLKATISFDSSNRVTFWTFEVPNSLEARISEVLKSNYTELTDCCNEEEVLSRATEVLGTDEEGVVRRSVSLFQDETWFNSFCNRAGASMDLY